MFEKDVQPMLEEADVQYELRETGNYIVTMYSSEIINNEVLIILHFFCQNTWVMPEKLFKI